VTPTSEHFCAFSFVDRITSSVLGSSIRGCYSIPPKVDTFPVSLAAEAVGQLAAWAAMEAVDFSRRPVAGIAGKIELLSKVRPGQVLELAAELESVDIETVGYSGIAMADGVPVIRLSDCVGPMVPLEDFDDPRSVREHCNRLRADGAVPNRFRGLPALTLEAKECVTAELALARLRVPSAASFFADHFPRRPVFPGTLLTHAKLQAATMLANNQLSSTGLSWLPRTISDVKLRSFISPDEKLDLRVQRTLCSESQLSVAVESRIGPRLVGSAEIHFAAAALP
jgi:3-hydroxymyristoyl/3-hydroxydecanoyl-(acyl carrier protein) dehydratase